MPIQVIRRTPQQGPTRGEKIGAALRGGLNQANEMYQAHQMKAEAEEARKAEDIALKERGYDLQGVRNPKIRELLIQGKDKQAIELQKQENQKKLVEFKDLTRRKLIEDISGNGFNRKQESKYSPDEYNRAIFESAEELGIPLNEKLYQDSFRDLVQNNELPREEIEEDPFREAELYAAAGEHDLSRVASERARAKNKAFEAERGYHTKFSVKQEEQADQLRESIPKKEMALNHARDAVETGNMGTFSLDYLADLTGKDVFRTEKGAQLITASKENLMSNMGKVSAKAQNQWFEQRLNSMFPKIGQSREANLTVQEMLEGEVALDKAYLNEFDRIAEEDMKRYGYVKKDVSKRAHQVLKPLEKEIFQRSTYRMKEIEEQEKGLKSMKSNLGKTVPKGTPLTLANAKLFKEKYGDKALKMAESLGYYVPSIEEFGIYQMTPQEFRERF